MAMHLGEATLNPGTISNDVKRVQEILTGQGYNVGPIDGNFGPLTASAVQSFQRKKGLVPDGIIGPQTWDALNGKIVSPSPDPMVTRPPIPTPVRIPRIISSSYYLLLGGIVVVSYLMMGRKS